MEWDTKMHLQELGNLLNEGKTQEVLDVTFGTLTSKTWAEDASPAENAEINALRGMAYYRRKEFPDARMCFYVALKFDPANERALYGMAYLAAYVDKDPQKTREWMDKLPESVARDNAWMIVMRSEEYISANGLDKTEAEVITTIEKYLKPNPDDPLNVANIFHNGGRFFMVEGHIAPTCYAAAIASLSLSLGLYGSGNTNLHHRAAANYWISVAQEKLFGPAAARSSAEHSFELWKRQLELDPTNKHFEKNYENAMARVDELRENAYSLERRGY